MIKRYFIMVGDGYYGPYTNKEENPSGDYCDFSDIQSIAKDAAWCINLLPKFSARNAPCFSYGDARALAYSP